MELAFKSEKCCNVTLNQSRTYPSPALTPSPYLLIYLIISAHLCCFLASWVECGMPMRRGHARMPFCHMFAVIIQISMGVSEVECLGVSVFSHVSFRFSEKFAQCQHAAARCNGENTLHVNVYTIHVKQHNSIRSGLL